MSKAKRKPQEPSTPKQPKTSLAAKRRKRKAKTTTVTKTTRTVVSNPPPWQDLTHVLLPGFGAYAATRILQRIVFTLVQKRWPRFGKHAHAAAGAAAFAGTWFVGHRIRKLAPYHDSIVMGSGIAALQGIATTYLPAKYNWLLSDCRTEDVAPAKQLPAPTNTNALPPASASAADGDEYSYLEDQLDELERSGSRRARSIPPPKARNTPVAHAMQMAQGEGGEGMSLDPDLIDEMDEGEDVDDFYSGSFSN